VFVKQAVVGVLREGAIAAGLTALLICGSRIMAVDRGGHDLDSVAIRTSLTVLYFLGDTSTR